MNAAPFLSRTGRAAPMPASNIDTDVIMPKQFLKGIDRAGLDRGLFHDLRFEVDGAEAAGFVLNKPAWHGARFLVVGPNFGCGSSREHAVWGLKQFGIEALIGVSFAGIFFDNCARNGLLALELAETEVAALMAAASDPDRNTFIIDLEAQTIAAPDLSLSFVIDARRRTALMRGLDQIGETLEARAEIEAFERRHFAANPWLAPDNEKSP